MSNANNPTPPPPEGYDWAREAGIKFSAALDKYRGWPTWAKIAAPCLAVVALALMVPDQDDTTAEVSSGSSSFAEEVQEGYEDEYGDADDDGPTARDSELASMQCYDYQYDLSESRREYFARNFQQEFAPDAELWTVVHDLDLMCSDAYGTTTLEFIKQMAELGQLMPGS